MCGVTLLKPPLFPDAIQNHEFLRLVINSIRNDIISKNENFQALALILVANGVPPCWLLRGACLA